MIKYDIQHSSIRNKSDQLIIIYNSEFEVTGEGNMYIKLHYCRQKSVKKREC